MLRKLSHVEEAAGRTFGRRPSGSGAKSHAALLHSSFLQGARSVAVNVNFHIVSPSVKISVMKLFEYQCYSE